MIEINELFSIIIRFMSGIISAQHSGLIRLYLYHGNAAFTREVLLLFVNLSKLQPLRIVSIAPKYLHMSMPSSNLVFEIAVTSSKVDSSIRIIDEYEI